ncbi:MAG: porin family protein [Ferruginibacter sp.]|nr:PorT family protein [Ferruginibacter sp.]
MKNTPQIIAKKILLFLTILLLTMNVFSQKSDRENFFKIGAKAGANINKIKGVAYKNGFNYNFQGGVFAQLKLTNKFGLQPEVNFVQTQTEFTNDVNTITDDLFGGGATAQHKAKLDYLEVPLLLNVNVGPTKKIKLQFGPAYGGLLKQTVDSLKTGVKNIYKNGEWSVIGGLWIQMSIINISARYKAGLSNINGFSNQQWKNQAIQVSLGITL